MHIAFAIAFFLFVGLCETLRHGVFGLNPSEIDGIIYGALAFMALFLLRGDVVYLLRQPRGTLYDSPRFAWSWTRSLLGIALVPLLWAIPALYGISLIQINLVPVSAQALLGVLAMQILLVALAEELFFREAAIKAFRSDIRAIYLMSGLASFIFYVPDGVAVALVAAGAGVFYLTLRLIGTNILLVAVAHGATVVVFSDILSLGLTSGEQWSFAGSFLAASLALSAVVFTLFAKTERRLHHA